MTLRLDRSTSLLAHCHVRQSRQVVAAKTDNANEPFEQLCEVAHHEAGRRECVRSCPDGVQVRDRWPVNAGASYRVDYFRAAYAVLNSDALSFAQAASICREKGLVWSNRHQYSAAPALLCCNGSVWIAFMRSFKIPIAASFSFIARKKSSYSALLISVIVVIAEAYSPLLARAVSTAGHGVQDRVTMRTRGSDGYAECASLDSGRFSPSVVFRSLI